MKKYFILGAIIIIALIAGALYLQPNGGADVATVNESVLTLEDEFDDLDINLRTGNLTPAEAQAARVRIITELEAIRTSGTQGARRGLTEIQRAELQEGLGRLVRMLETYLVTLSTVDAIAAEADPATTDSNVPRNLQGKTILEVITETLTDLAAAAEIDRPLEELSPEEPVTPPVSEEFSIEVSNGDTSTSDTEETGDTNEAMEVGDEDEQN